MKYTLIAIAILVPYIVFSQEKENCKCCWEKKTESSKVVWTQLSIREAFEDVNDKQKPAKSTITWPQGESPLFMVNAGLALSINRICNRYKENESRTTFSAFAVYNRNTLIKKYQDLFKAGGSVEYRFGKTTDEVISYGYWNTTMQYVDNRKDTANSVLLTSYISPFRMSNKKNPGIFLNDQQRLFWIFDFMLSPQAGIEYQNTFRAKDPKLKGNIFRSYIGASISLFILKPEKNTKADKWNNMFELRAGYTLRNELINTSEVKDNSIPLFKTDFIYYPFFNSNVSLALSYNDGADPVAGLADQKFWMLTLQIRK
jgi:hypothetical protein